MVERYPTLRSACSGPLWKKPRALRRTKSGSAVSKSHSMSSERQQKSNTPRWARRAWAWRGTWRSGCRRCTERRRQVRRVRRQGAAVGVGGGVGGVGGGGVSRCCCGVAARHFNLIPGERGRPCRVLPPRDSVNRRDRRARNRSRTPPPQGEALSR